MSKIHKLSIIGVRSFDNNRWETIQFNTPLTLIVGTNGSGKTTIIECLKYATTGILPANARSGGGFVHDPKLCGETDVVAQVKLSFKSVSGTMSVCSRKLHASIKKASTSQSAGEASLNLFKDGDKTVISSRVADLDTVMPQYLGVSTAILDHVIFCHQEDSLWPLSLTAADLKIRFDAIFDALKYTKAITSIKELQKSKRAQLAVLKNDEEHTKHIKGKAEQNETRTKRFNEELEVHTAECDRFDHDIRAADDKIAGLWKKAHESGNIVGELKGKRIEEKTKEESVQSLKETLNEMSDSDEDLQRMLEQYEERVRAFDNDLADHKTQYGELTDDLQATRNRITQKGTERGQYEAEKLHYDRQVENREQLVKETARSHNVRGFDMDVDDDQVQVFMDRVAKMARDQNAAFERARRETQEELQIAQKTLSRINEQRSALNQRKESTKQTVANNDRKIGSLQTNLNNMTVDEGSKATIESNLRDTEAKLESAKSDAATANWDISIERAETELRQLDDRKETLDAELVEGTRQAGDSAQLDFVQKELKDRQRSLDTMTGAHGDRIATVIGQEWTPPNIESDYQRAIEQSGSHVAEAERQRDGTTREMEQLEYKLSSCRDDLKNKRDALKAAQKNIQQAMDIDPEDYPDQILSLEHSRDIAKSDAESFSKILEYFETCVKNANDHNGCRTCARPFKNAQEREKMLTTVNKEKKRLEGGEEVRNDLKDSEEALREARAVSSDYDTWKKVKEEIPGLEEIESKLMEKREQLIRQLEDQDAVVSDRQAAKRDVEAIRKTVSNIAKYSAEISNLEIQVKELTAKQKTAGLSRGLEIIQQDIKQVNEKAKTVKTQLNQSTGDRDRSTKRINHLEREKHDIENKLGKAEYELKQKKSLEDQIAEYKEMNSEQRESMKSIDVEIQGLSPQLAQAQAKYDDIDRRGEDKKRELQEEATKINNSLSDLRKADQDVKAYIERGGPEQLARAKREAETLENEQSRLEEEQKHVVIAVKKLEAQHQNHANTKREISENQRYRRDLRQLHEVRKRIQELEGHNAEKVEEHFSNEARNKESDRIELMGKRQELAATIKSHQMQIKYLLQEYETDYKDAAKKYKEAHIKLETTKACVEDLGRYSSALDKAVMKYHTIKMEQINSCLAELWRETYQGTDVDAIMIRTELVDVTKGNKQYKYRVVMVKQDVEMDMRGRCSAGQKVLACILIRLALAECFGTKCGLIALDEPTTNLDHDNICALAKALNKIIHHRRVQDNFQLIVITHDEDFLRQMQCSDFADVYWRVFRNEKQKSEIERQDISEVV